MAPSDTKFSQNSDWQLGTRLKMVPPLFSKKVTRRITDGRRRKHGLPQDDEGLLGGLGGGGVDRRLGHYRAGVSADTGGVDRGNGSGPPGTAGTRRERHADESSYELHVFDDNKFDWRVSV